MPSVGGVSERVLCVEEESDEMREEENEGFMEEILEIHVKLRI